MPILIESGPEGLALCNPGSSGEDRSGRSEDFLSRGIAQPREDERALLARLTDYEWRRPELDELLALVDGLRVAVCAPVKPMRLEAAREILAARCHTLPGIRVHPSQTRSRRTR
jgi:hypothetical protein